MYSKMHKQDKFMYALGIFLVPYFTSPFPFSFLDSYLPLLPYNHSDNACK